MDYTFVSDADQKETDEMVRMHHYSGRPAPGSSYRAALADDRGRLVAAVMFKVPPTRWSQPVLELTRLIRLPGAKPPLTQLVGKACRELQRRRLTDLVVSFADSTQGHHGGVYQACLWNYHEQRQAQNDGFVIDGEFVPRRTAYDRYGTSSRQAVADLCEVLGCSFAEHWDTGKHLYWRALTPKGAAQASALGLKAAPYFKALA